MKKLLAIVVLGLLWSNAGFSHEINLGGKYKGKGHYHDGQYYYVNGYTNKLFTLEPTGDECIQRSCWKDSCWNPLNSGSAKCKAEVEKRKKNKEKKNILEYEKAHKRNLEIIKGTTSNGNKFEFDTIGQTINEYTIAPSYLKGSIIVEDLYYMSEFSSKKVVAEIPYSLFVYRLGKKYGGTKKFNKRYKKEIAESKINCGCEDPIYKTFLLDLETRYAYKVFHPQSNDPKLDGDFRLKRNMGHKIVSSSVSGATKTLEGFVNIISSDTAELLINAYIIYSAVENPQGIFKKSKGSSNVPGSSSASKSLSSGSGSVLDNKFGEVTLKQLIGASRR